MTYRGTSVSKREAKRVLLDARGPLPLPCDDCGKEIKSFGSRAGHVHHNDHDPFHNVPENLSLLDVTCHQKRHNASEITRRRRRESAINRNSSAPLQRPDVVARRKVTLKARYLSDPELRKRMSQVVTARFEDPKYASHHRAAIQASWDGNDERREHMSKVSKASFTNGVQVKISCPNGCGMETFPGPMGRHTKAGNCQPTE